MKDSRFLMDEVLPFASAHQNPPEEPSISRAGKEVRFGVNHSLSLSLSRLSYRVYRVEVEYPQSQSKINYEITARGKGISGKIAHLRFSKEHYFINGYTPAKVADELDILLAKTLYPLEIRIDYRQGISQVTNIKEIKSRYYQNKFLIEREYTGELFNTYLSRIEQHLEDPFGFSRQLNKDLFFSLYTHCIYETYTPKLEIDSILTIFFCGRYLKFKGLQKIETAYNHQCGVYLRFQGITEGEEYGIEAEYNLDGNTFTIKDIIATVYQKEKKNKKAVIQMKVHQLRERESSEETRQTNGFEPGEKDYKKAKKSWFDKLFGF